MEGRNLGARIAEGTFAAAQDFDSALAYTTDLKARAVRLGRDPSQIVVMPGLSVFLADSDEEARAQEDARLGKLDFNKSLVELGRLFNYHDFGVYDPDAPFPDVSNLTLNSYKGAAERLVATARSEALTLRETVARFLGQRSPFVGTARTVADEIERWFLAGAIDGFNLHVTRPGDFDRFLNEVVPILQERGLFRTDYSGATLREHLGLPVPENRYTAERRQVEALAAE
ncbi:LLM class flavin-dependent oxidoreductase [Sphingomonas sp. SRS2]|uniref:LLM class flavin-dependent oxidoreductase n=1 Tax=Sphingomonas sp. SRS2 TaxID=133190 RepID=UPI00069607DE|nr:LLM class flavin-dependent oxidoreductase [Sphingomonas sp. SRS2]